MNREILERMTKEELINFASMQEEVINRLDMQRYDANAVIDHLVRATHDMHNLRCHDAERENAQDYLDDFARQMYAKYPTYIFSADGTVRKEQRNDNK